MSTLLIEVTDEKAYQLLKQLEEMHIIRVLKQKGAENIKDLSDKYAGKLKLSDEEYADFQNYIAKGRDEW